MIRPYRWLALLMALLACSCNPIKGHYEEFVERQPSRKPAQEVRIRKVILPGDLDEYFRNGYALVGRTQFESRNRLKRDELKQWGAKVSADAIVAEQAPKQRFERGELRDYYETTVYFLVRSQRLSNERKQQRVIQQLNEEKKIPEEEAPTYRYLRRKEPAKE